MSIKRAVSGFFCALLCAGLISGCAFAGGARQDDEPYSALRLHIIANSDSEADQSVKLAVRDAVLQAP